LAKTFNFLDKKTGTWQMGWHEHPMKQPEYIIQKTDSADSDTGQH
jgi:hypothetical protein